MSFIFTRLDIPDIILIRSDSYPDKRGFFSEVYRQDKFSEVEIGPFIQENYSCSVKGVLRGIHYQSNPMALGKLVSCPHGKIWDVAIDIRKESSTFGKWTAAFLEDGKAMLWIPPGFAHGFCVLSDTANVLYRQTQYFSKEHDRNIKWNDSDIGINWPISNPLISDKDSNAPLLKDIPSDQIL